METKLQIPSNFYNALRIVSAKNDVREYLNGILIDFKKRRWAATDGHRLLIIPMNKEVCQWAAKDVPDELIIETTRQKISGDTCEIHIEERDNKWTIVVCNMRNGLVIWQEIVQAIGDCKFPDIDRVTPSWPKKDPINVPLAAYNPQYLADVSKEFSTKYPIARVMPTGDKAGNAALVEFGGITREQLTYVLMPMRW